MENNDPQQKHSNGFLIALPFIIGIMALSIFFTHHFKKPELDKENKVITDTLKNK